jgi:ABC-type transport system substrate-binding protein
VDAPMDPSLEGYCAVGEWEFDPDGARELLEEADAVGTEIDFIAPTGRYIQDFEVAQAVAGFLEEVGFDVSGPETMDWPSYIERITAEADDQQQDLHLLGWAPSYMDSFQHMVIFQTNQHPPNGLATAFYSNDEVDSILADASTEVDPDARQQMYCEASEILWDEAPFVFLYSQRFPIVYSADLTGASFRPNEGFYMLDARPAPAGDFPVVLAPGTGGVLIHEACGHGLEADTLVKNASVYAQRNGDRFGSTTPMPTLIDRSRRASVCGSMPLE